MTPEEKENINYIVAMSFRDFLGVCVAWKEETQTDLVGIDPRQCPVHQYALEKGRCLGTSGHTEQCPVCDNAMCPTCGSHCVDQISRVTGYMQAVSGWNAAKKQEYIDRKRHNIPSLQ